MIIERVRSGAHVWFSSLRSRPHAAPITLVRRSFAYHGARVGQHASRQTELLPSGDGLGERSTVDVLKTPTPEGGEVGLCGPHQPESEHTGDPN